jgi:hypothetical protein
MEMINIRKERNKLQNGRAMEIINKTKSYFIDKINKMTNIYLK